MNPWRAPQRVRVGHVADKASEFLARTPGATDRPRLPGPVPGEAAPMPPDDRRRAHDDQSGAPVRPTTMVAIDSGLLSWQQPGLHPAAMLSLGVWRTEWLALSGRAQLSDGAASLNTAAPSG